MQCNAMQCNAMQGLLSYLFMQQSHLSAQKQRVSKQLHLNKDPGLLPRKLCRLAGLKPRFSFSFCRLKPMAKLAGVDGHAK